MSEPDPGETAPSRVATLCSGAVTGLLAYGAAFVVTMSIVPRKPEGGRQIVDWPWPLYALFPVLLAMAMVVVLMWGLSNPRLQHRLVWILASSAVVGLCAYYGIDLLRRDHIGKF